MALGKAPKPAMRYVGGKEDPNAPKPAARYVGGKGKPGGPKPAMRYVGGREKEERKKEAKVLDTLELQFDNPNLYAMAPRKQLDKQVDKGAVTVKDGKLDKGKNSGTLDTSIGKINVQTEDKFTVVAKDGEISGTKGQNLTINAPKGKPLTSVTLALKERPADFTNFRIIAYKYKFKGGKIDGVEKTLYDKVLTAKDFDGKEFKATFPGADGVVVINSPKGKAKEEDKYVVKGLRSKEAAPKPPVKPSEKMTIKDGKLDKDKNSGTLDTSAGKVSVSTEAGFTVVAKNGEISGTKGENLTINAAKGKPITGVTLALKERPAPYTNLRVIAYKYKFKEGKIAGVEKTLYNKEVTAKDFDGKEFKATFPGADGVVIVNSPKGKAKEEDKFAVKDFQVEKKK